MDIELTPAAENYLSAVVKGQIPKPRGAAGLAVQRKLIKNGLLTEKGNPTKKAKTYFETPDGPVEPPHEPAEDHIPVYNESDGSPVIGYMEPDEITGTRVYDLYILDGEEMKKIGFTADENTGIGRIRREYEKLTSSGSCVT